MKCSKCSNEGRYLRADGKFYCGLHAMGHHALRISDVGAVLDDVYFLTLPGRHRAPPRRLEEVKARLRAVLGMIEQNCQTVEIRSTNDDRSP